MESDKKMVCSSIPLQYKFDIDACRPIAVAELVLQPWATINLSFLLRTRSTGKGFVGHFVPPAAGKSNKRSSYDGNLPRALLTWLVIVSFRTFADKGLCLSRTVVK